MIGEEEMDKDRVKGRDSNKSRGRDTSSTLMVPRGKAVGEESKEEKASKAEDIRAWDLSRCRGGGAGACSR